MRFSKKREKQIEGSDFDSGVEAFISIPLFYWTSKDETASNFKSETGTVFLFSISETLNGQCTDAN